MICPKPEGMRMTRREDPLDHLLGPLEQDVMDVVWSLGDATVRDVHEQLAAGRKIAYTTVMTTMSRLAAKGMLAKDATGLAHRYRPAVSRDSYARDTLGNMLGWMLDRFPEPAASFLAEVVGDEPGQRNLDDLRAAVERRRDEES